MSTESVLFDYLTANSEDLFATPITPSGLAVGAGISSRVAHGFLEAQRNAGRLIRVDLRYFFSDNPTARQYLSAEEIALFNGMPPPLHVYLSRRRMAEGPIELFMPVIIELVVMEQIRRNVDRQSLLYHFLNVCQVLRKLDAVCWSPIGRLLQSDASIPDEVRVHANSMRGGGFERLENSTATQLRVIMELGIRTFWYPWGIDGLHRTSSEARRAMVRSLRSTLDSLSFPRERNPELVKLIGTEEFVPTAPRVYEDGLPEWIDWLTHRSRFATEERVVRACQLGIVHALIEAHGYNDDEIRELVARAELEEFRFSILFNRLMRFVRRTPAEIPGM